MNSRGLLTYPVQYPTQTSCQTAIASQSHPVMLNIFIVMNTIVLYTKYGYWLQMPHTLLHNYTQALQLRLLSIVCSYLSEVEMKFLLALHVAVAFIITSFSLVTAKGHQEDEEVNVTGCLAPTSGRATFTVVGQQGVKGDPGPEGLQGPRGRKGSERRRRWSARTAGTRRPTRTVWTSQPTRNSRDERNLS